MKRLAILIGLVLLVAGGGATWWFLLREPPAEQTADAAPDESASGTGVDRILRFVELEPFVIPILREGRVTQHRTIILTVELTNPTRMGTINSLTPRLRDAILSTLHGVLAFRHVQDGGEDQAVIRDRLVKAGETVFGAGEIKSVLVKAATRRTPDAG